MFANINKTVLRNNFNICTIFQYIILQVHIDIVAIRFTIDAINPIKKQLNCDNCSLYVCLNIMLLVCLNNKTYKQTSFTPDNG